MKFWKRFQSRSIVCLVAALLLTAFATRAFAQEYVAGEVLVKFKAGPFSGRQGSARIEAREVSVVQGVGVSRVRLPRGMSVPAAVAHFSMQPGVEFAEPNYLFHLLVEPDDPLYPLNGQWGLRKVRAPEAWNITTGSSAVKVAILDTGIDMTHPDLAGKVVLAKDHSVADGTDDITDYNGHGTHCAGIVASCTNNTLGVASMGWNTSLMIGKVGGEDGMLRLDEIANAVDWATQNGANVISMSIGSNKHSQTLKQALQRAWNSGVVLVAAAGNSGFRTSIYPAAYSVCISVGATDQADAKASFSNWGDSVDVVAPGVGITSTYRGGGYATMSGTSMATPLVAGLAALIWSTPHGVNAAAVRSRIETTGVTVTSGFGAYPRKRIDAFAAVTP